MKTLKISLSKNVDNIHYYGSSIAIFDKLGKIHLFKNPIEVFIVNNIVQGITLNDLAFLVHDKFIQSDEKVNDVEIIIKNFLTTDQNVLLFDFKNYIDEMPVVTGQRNKFFPTRLQIDLTNKCNLFCKHCYKEANKSATNIDVEKIKDLFQFLGSTVHEIGLTGGEPLLHTDFDTIVEVCRNKCQKLELNTNGILIYKKRKDILKKFDFISISLYGLNDEQYYCTTGFASGFSMLKKSCEVLKSNNISFNVSLIINKLNLNEMDSYVECAIDLGASTIQFGTVSKLGRANDKNTEWLFLSSNEKRDAYRNMRQLISKYGKRIKILEWEREVYKNYSLSSSFYNLYGASPFYCTAGTLQWSINEDFLFKPCVLMPNEENLVISYEKWKKYVEGIDFILWNEYIKNICSYCSKQAQSPTDYCERLIINQ